jgi:tubulin polyglutamylase TTLL6/13
MSVVSPLFISETQYAVVKHVTKKNRWNLIVDPVSSMNFDIAWVDGITKLDIFQKMGCYQKINHFPGTLFSYAGMGILSRKNNLGKNLMLFRRKFPDDYEFFPITWHLP